MSKASFDEETVASSVAPPLPPNLVYLPDEFGPKKISPLALNERPVVLGSRK